jgi:hypothetical protein
MESGSLLPLSGQGSLLPGETPAPLTPPPPPSTPPHVTMISDFQQITLFTLHLRASLNRVSETGEANLWEKNEFP